MIALENVSKSYGTHRVLHRISFKVEAGEILGIIGPSGGGKTTLLRCINYLTPFEEGLIRIGDVELSPALPPAVLRERIFDVRRRIGMVFQQFNLFPHRTAVGNIIEAPVRVLHHPIEEARRVAYDLLEEVGMSDRSDAYPARLSGGEQQRVAIARALAMHPEAILFDEPTSSLDPERVGDMIALLRLLASQSMTMIIVSHSIRFIRAVADRVIFMADGVIVEEGKPQDVLVHPTQERTKQFLKQEELI